MLTSITRRGKRAVQAFAVLTLAIAAAVAFLPSTPAGAATDAGDSISVSGRPAGADGRPDDRTRFSYSADPGQSVNDNFLIGNRSNQVRDFTVYGTDAFNAEDGSFSLLATADEPTGVGAWTRFENGEPRVQFTLGPGEVRVVPFTIQFPAEATPGDHVGGIVASVIEPGEQVNVDRRVATGVFARVSGEVQPRLAISNFEAFHHGDWWNPFGGTVTVRYTVDNPGNISLAGNVTLGVNTWFGIPAAPSRGGTIPDLLPGNSASFEFDMPAVGQWLYLNPHLRLSPFVDDTDPAKQVLLEPTTRDTVTWAPPWTILILVGVAALIALSIWWKRRRDDAHARAWLEHTQDEARREAQREAGLIAAGKARGDG